MLASILLLSASLLASDSVPAPRLEQTRTAERAAVVLHRQPGLPVVSLRLSLLANDPPGYSGAGHMVQHLVYPGLQERVDRVGGQLQMQRTSDAIVYTVTGPASELDYLAQLLTSALSPPAVPVDAILRAERDLREERLAEWETAPSHARSHLRAQLFPADISAAGTDRSATRLTASALPRIWADLYDPANVSVVAVGDVYLDDVEEAFSNLPPKSDSPSLNISRDSVVLGSLAPAQATRGWIASAYLASDQPPAAVNVAVRLLGERLRRAVPTAQVDAEHWWTHHGQAAALVAAAPANDLPALRRTMGTVVASLLEDVSFLQVTNAAAAIRRELLFYSRTPDRMAEMIGQFVDREGDAQALERFYADLDAMDDRDVRAVLERLLERTPARIEIPPQTLRAR